VRALLVCAPAGAPVEDAPAARPADLVVLRAGEIEAGIAGFR
jgi:hypothetical protein